MPQLTEKHFFRYIKCPLWLYFDVHADEQKLHDPLMERLQDDGLLPEAEAEIVKDMSYAEVGIEDVEEAFGQTLKLMREGVQTIYHGVLVKGHWVARPDLLEKVEGKSRFGDYYYVAIDIKQGRRLRAEYMFQGAFYAEVLKLIQGTKPTQGYVISPDGDVQSYLIEDFESRFHLTLDAIERILAGQRPAHFVSGGCKQSPWFSECQSEAEACNDLSLINRIRPSEVKAIRDAEISNISALSKADRDKLEGIGSIDLDRLLYLRDQATALTKGAHIVHEPVELPEADVELYFDVESDPLRDLHYLFGVLEVKQGKAKYHSFVAAKPEEEEKAWLEFLEFMGEHPDAPIYHWGWFEIDVIRHLAAKYGMGESVVAQMEQNMIDLLPAVRDSVIMPVYYYSLKDIAGHLGYKWKEEGATGAISVLWYEEYLKNRRKKSILTKIIKYNEDDVRATWHVKKWVVEQTAKV
ncbi:MAG: TM0106 family RecB-like putative nuclease [Candidatus Uhrbacteria bacterium]|nr:TM0106 family RecB-like putative nuclease [Patescibacteria group bacterium]MBU1906659.1 TM0106 family RecB-like putative nuclease [Patescibacteria group bacterium]